MTSERLCQGEYVGAELRFKGKTALLRDNPHDLSVIRAQFDDLALGQFAYGWHTFQRGEFVITGDRGNASDAIG